MRSELWSDWLSGSPYQRRQKIPLVVQFLGERAIFPCLKTVLPKEDTTARRFSCQPPRVTSPTAWRNHLSSSPGTTCRSIHRVKEPQN
jgi:hypothetical protein